jgi:hypothetical protein
MDAYRVLVEKLDRKKTLGRLSVRRRWENNIKIVRFEVSTAVTMMIIIFWEMIIINIKIDLGGIGQGYGLDSSGSG